MLCLILDLAVVFRKVSLLKLHLLPLTGFILPQVAVYSTDFTYYYKILIQFSYGS